MIVPMLKRVSATSTNVLRPSEQSEVNTGWKTAEQSTKDVLVQ